MENIKWAVLTIAIFLLAFILIDGFRTQKIISDLATLQTKITELEKRVSVREIPKLHCQSATIFINGGEITVKTDQTE